MTTENKSIWHNFMDYPNSDKNIVVLSKDGVYDYGKLGHNFKLSLCDNCYDWFTDIEKWAYIDDLISASKALDVAIDALKSIRDMDNELEDPKVAIKALQTISKIKKGNKL